MDYIDPPRLPKVIQPYYEPHEVEAVLKAIGKGSAYELRDTAVVLTLFDSGVRAAEVCGMKVEDVNWRDLSIKVTGCTGRPVHPHELRHLYVKTLIDGVIPVVVASKLVGHSDSRTTERWYYDLTAEQ